MDADRPFSGPVSVSLAGLTLLGLAAWSFGSGLSRELRLARTDVPQAHVVVLPPKPAASPPSSADLAYMAALPPQPAPPVHRPRRHPNPDASPPVLPDIAPAAPAAPAAAEVVGAEAAAAVPAPPDDSPADASAVATP